MTVEIEVMYTVTPPVASVIVEAIIVGSAEAEDEAVIDPAEVAADPPEVPAAALALETADPAELTPEAAVADDSSPPPPPDPAWPPMSAPC